MTKQSLILAHLSMTLHEVEANALPPASNCCDAPLVGDTVQCSACKELCTCCHCGVTMERELFDYDPDYPLCDPCGYRAYKC